MDRSLGLADILKLNDQELPALVEMLSIPQGGQAEAIAGLMSGYQLSHVILTKGAAGSEIYTPNEVSFCESRQVPVVDTVGAGDAFAAAVVMGLLEKKPLSELHHRASRIAEYVCTKPGATPLLDRGLL